MRGMKLLVLFVTWNSNCWEMHRSTASDSNKNKTNQVCTE